MARDDILYFRIERAAGIKYIAASSREAVTKVLGDSKIPTSHAALFGYNLRTLELVTEAEAKRADLSEWFLRSGKLCRDGTFMLGTVGFDQD